MADEIIQSFDAAWLPTFQTGLVYDIVWTQSNFTLQQSEQTTWYIKYFIRFNYLTIAEQTLTLQY